MSESPRPAFEVVSDEPASPRRVPWATLGLLFVSLVSIGAAVALAVRLQESRAEAEAAKAQAEDATQRAAAAEKQRAEDAQKVRDAIANVFKPGALDFAKPTEKPPEVKKDEQPPEKWAGVNEWSTVGDLSVRVTKAELRKPPLRSRDHDRRYEGKEPELMLSIEIRNNSEVRKVLYGRWGGLLSGDTPDGAADEHGNRYRVASHGDFSGEYVEGGLEYSTKDIRPGDPIVKDVICFERPVGAAKEIRITLTGKGDAKGL
jgi:hypothetical protein